ncbi:MAG: acyltransferase family protein [Ilumatobacteraceae bacterium]
MEVRSTDSYFRPEIQGLRGVAVLLVVLYHSKVGFSGGYVGVDVFFVISGYVITLLLLREFGSGKPHAIRRFYKRRIQRLFPAAAVAVASVVIFSLLALSPTYEVKQVTDLARSTAKFVANFKLLEEPSYFTLQNPLQHMWSLAVEEQFYLIFPIGLLLLLKIFKRSSRSTTYVLASLMTVGFFSFLGCVALSNGRGSEFIADKFHTTSENFAFYMMPSRMWEFCVGACLALVPQRGSSRSSKLQNLVAIVGALAVLFAAITFDSKTRFPGLAAVFPVLGTAAIIRSVRFSSFMYAFLCTRLMRFIGDISYSWYLWHWPAIVFAAVLVPNNSFILIVGACVSLVPAILSYRFVENRYRRRATFSSLKFVAFCSALILAPIVTANLVDAASPHLENRTPDMFAIKDRRFSVVNGCHGAGFPLSERCYIKQSGALATAVLFGDSHAASASDGVVNAAKSSGLNIGVSTSDGCPPFLLDPGGVGCPGVRIIYEQIMEQLDPQIVILVSSLQHYAPTDLPSVGVTATFIAESEINYVRSLVAGGRHVIVVLEVPEMDIEGQPSLLRPRVRTSTTQLSEQVWRNWLNSQIRIGLEDLSAVTIVETDGIYCPNSLCNPRENGVLLYRDGGHLNPEGSAKLVGPIRDAIRVQLSVATATP